MEPEIRELELSISRAIVAGNTEFVEQLFADDFFYTGVRGELKGKRELLAEMKTGALKFELMDFSDLQVRHFGDTAVVTGLATTKGRNAEGEISGRFRYTRVYALREGRWRLVLFQGTPLR